MVLLVIVPAMFATNIVVGRAAAETVPPFALAFWRWLTALAVLLPFVAGGLVRHRAAILAEWRDLLVLGILGMGICGAFMYIGADTTTATNIGLIYATSPVLIVVLARLVYGEPMTARRTAGVALALAGVLVIVFRGSAEAVRALAFVDGDIWVAIAALAWGGYSVIQRFRSSAMPPHVRFAAIILFGVLALAPFHVAELATGAIPALDLPTAGAIAVCALVPGIGAYMGYARIQRALGAGPASLFLYVQPLYVALMSWLLLSETIEGYHLAGAALILPGVFLATRRAG